MYRWNLFMSKQTAVEWLVDELLSGKPLMPDLIEQAKEMEKEQTTEAYIAGSHHLPIPPKTYGGNHE
jgi:hypothetical protein